MAEDVSQNPERQFAVQRIYLKDLSFESPNAPEVFRGEWKPQHELNLNTRVNRLEGPNFEVVLALTVTVKVGERTAFIVELEQAGIFHVQGFPEAELGPMLGAYCPSILFPYAREAVTDLVVKGSFPQLVLQHVNFDLLYAQRQQQARAEAEAGESEARTH